MPRVSAFYGVVIYMYWNERVTRWLTSTPTTQGAEPQSRWTGTYLLAAWSLGRSQFVREWASLRREEILANWERARKNESLLGIPPLP